MLREIILDTKGLVNTTVLSTKISEIESEIENNTPDKSKYITIQESNKLTAEHF